MAGGIEKSLNRLLIYMNIIFKGIKNTPLTRALFKLYPNREYIPN